MSSLNVILLLKFTGPTISNDSAFGIIIDVLIASSSITFISRPSELANCTKYDVACFIFIIKKRSYK
ncbi:ORF MSV033 hypothetical protein [Melanoplus sanguinipes entomopoxvirus]|uniref:Uncharacterized protein n=1 Tax=Melanoplus sanguinipes entomopoxvirus TaxID=83191 RepID=Q9YW60_MSEPV|nr:ORF MSV033 hypothetical protein [Melanoplus sanguinipes entomopoxvirus]AAC97840.1 ORF MSV033 hypothetical protein [Melanoplus sanguinipes entomopoxvirus 'O']